MKKTLLILAGLAALASCSEKTYTETLTSTFEVPAAVNKLSAPSQGNVILVEASSDVSWTASKDPADTWVTLLQTQGTGNGEVVYTLAENEGTDSRPAVITFNATGDNGTFTKTCTINQIGTSPVILISPVGTATINSDAVPAYEIQITSNVAWSIDIETSDWGDWITATDPASESGSGEYTALFNIEENESGASRIATITISADEFEGVSQELVLTQLQKGVTYTIAFTGLTSETPSSVEAVMSVAPVAGGASTNLEGELADDGTSTVFSFTEMLSAGDYAISSITPDEGSTVALDCRFTVGAGGLVTWVEHYDAALEAFGGNSEARPLYVADEDALKAVRDAVNAGANYAGLYLEQTANIALTSAWTPIGTSATVKFAGKYLGKNKEITGLSINSTADNQALFGAIGGLNADTIATVKDLVVKGTASNPNYDVVTTSDVANYAGIVGVAFSYSTLDNCINYAKVQAGVGGKAMGGVMGLANGDQITISKCKNYGDIKNNIGLCGGLVGNIQGTAGGAANSITSCYNFGKIDVTASAASAVTGGLIGKLSAPGVTTVEKCGNHGAVTMAANSNGGTGGLIGVMNGPANEDNGRTTVSQCYNVGTVVGFSNTSGLVSLCNTANAAYTQILNSYNRGTITFGTRTAANSAGVAGNATANYTIKVVNCYNAGTATGTASGADKFSGIVSANTIPAGGTDNFTGVSGCYYLENIGYSGGIGGSITPADAAGKAEVKAASFFAAAISGWDTAIWSFTGSFPALVNNPEQVAP